MLVSIKPTRLWHTNMVYDVDLTKPAAPIGTLTVVHKNNAADIICKQWDKIQVAGRGGLSNNGLLLELHANIYAGWNKTPGCYAAIYPGQLDAHQTRCAARVDTLDNDGIAGVQAFGTLQVVPGGESVVTTFRFALPASIVQSGTGQSIYHLLVQKQPGTLAEPITIRVHLPNECFNPIGSKWSSRSG